MARWLAGMLGRYFSSQSGDILVMPSPPQRENWNRPSLVETLHDPVGELLGHGEHVVGAEGDARAVRVERAEFQAGVGQGPLGGGHAHLTLAAHHLQALADGFLLFLVQGAKVVDLAGELPGLAAKADGHAVGRATPQGFHAATPLGQRLPQGLFGIAQRADNPHPGDNDSSCGLNSCGHHSGFGGQPSAVSR